MSKYEIDDYDFGDRKFKLTYSDNSTEEIYLNDMTRGYFYPTSATGTETDVLTKRTHKEFT